MTTQPTTTLGMRHLALFVHHFAACVSFYTDILGMEIEWQPDDDNVYLTSGGDNLALHRAPSDFTPNPHQHLDHFGFILPKPEAVDAWHTFLLAHNVTIVAPPKTHRDGARSLYCRDPDGNVVQLIYHPPISDHHR